ncbi:MAG TPA: DUF899 family protein [Gaiellales bacterium]|jgi:predicted dithiol-disulfide oxidoreductase (DUF899 family)|nr:DUF899 family protein [Gaiellales bacterium]
MPEHTIGTREEWQAARAELAKLEAEQAERNEEVEQQRVALPWVPVEKEYVFDTKDGRKTLAELFDGRSQLLAYNVMFGPDYTLGACPGCTSLADGLDGTLVHLNHRDVTLICFSRAPIEQLTAYKARMGWEFPYVSTYNTDFAADFGLMLTEEQAQEIPEVRQLIEDPPEWLEHWAGQVGADLKDGLRENPSWIAFAYEDGTVYHTYTVSAPDPFVAPYFSFLLERTPMPRPGDFRSWRKDEYPDWGGGGSPAASADSPERRRDDGWRRGTRRCGAARQPRPAPGPGAPAPPSRRARRPDAQAPPTGRGRSRAGSCSPRAR